MESLNLTLKEQAIYVNVHLNIDELRQAMLYFVREYNRSWQLKKLGVAKPLETRQRYESERSIYAAAQSKFVPGIPGAVHNYMARH